MKSFIYAIVLVFIPTETSCFLENVCKQTDLDYLKPKIAGTLGTIDLNKCQIGHVLLRKSRVSLIKCVKECFKINQCEGINYRKQWNMCELVTNTSTLNLVEEEGCSFTYKESWPKSLGGKCADHECREGRRCEMVNNNIKCLATYCSAPYPSIDNAVPSEMFGLSRNIGVAYSYKCNQGYTMIGRPFLFCKRNRKWKVGFCCVPEGSVEMNGRVLHDCNSLYKDRCRNGIYTISPSRAAKFDVYCRLRNEKNKNWHIIQKRKNGAVNFSRNWTEYENGFGSLNGEFWLGNEKIHQLTKAGNTFLRIDLKYYDGRDAIARFTDFQVDSKANRYRLTLLDHRNNSAGLGDSFIFHNGMNFTTFDQDNDLKFAENCAKLYHGGWWYKNWHGVNLNGLFGDRKDYAQGIQWMSLTKHNFSLKTSTMMIRKP